MCIPPEQHRTRHQSQLLFPLGVSRVEKFRYSSRRPLAVPWRAASSEKLTGQRRGRRRYQGRCLTTDKADERRRRSCCVPRRRCRVLWWIWTPPWRFRGEREGVVVGGVIFWLIQLLMSMMPLLLLKRDGGVACSRTVGIPPAECDLVSRQIAMHSAALFASRTHNSAKVEHVWDSDTSGRARNFEPGGTNVVCCSDGVILTCSKEKNILVKQRCNTKYTSRVRFVACCSRQMRRSPCQRL